MSCWAPDSRTRAVSVLSLPDSGLARALQERAGALGEPSLALCTPQPELGILALCLPPAPHFLMPCCSCVQVLYLHEQFSVEGVMEHSHRLQTCRTPSFCSPWGSSSVFSAE